MKNIMCLILSAVMLFASIGVVSATDTDVMFESVDFNDFMAISWPTDTGSPNYESQLSAAKNLTTLLPEKGINLSHYNPDWLSGSTHYNVVDSGTARGKYLELIKQNTTDTNSVQITIPVNYTKNNDVLVFEYDFKASGLGGVNYESIYVVGKDSGNIEHQLVKGLMYADSFYFDPSGTGGPGYVAGTWYSAKIILDLYTGEWTFTTQAEGSETVSTTKAYFPSAVSATDKSFVQSVSYLNLKLGHLSTAYGSSTASLCFDNIKSYTIDKTFAPVSSSIANGASLVKIDKEVTYTFNNNILPASLENVVVSANGTALKAGTDYTLSLVAEDSKLHHTVQVNFPKFMEYGTTYIVSFPETFSDAIGQTLGMGISYRFTTERPTFSMSNITAKYGLTGSGESITNLTSAGGQMIRVSVTATNTTGSAASGVIILALYNDGVLINCGTIERNFDTNETETMSCAMRLPADSSKCELKAFVCHGFSDLTALGALSSFSAQVK